MKTKKKHNCEYNEQNVFESKHSTMHKLDPDIGINVLMINSIVYST